MTKQYRYSKAIGKNEKEYNTHVRELIYMLKNEKVKANLYVKNVKLSNHALKRYNERFSKADMGKATREVRAILKDAKRIGTIVSFEGRLNVLYAKDKTAFYLSPDLKTVVTINKYEQVSYEPILSLMLNKVLSDDEVLQFHLDRLRELEQIEEKQEKRLLEIERNTSETTRTCSEIINSTKKSHGKFKEVISDEALKLKREGWKLFGINIEKRQLLKSLVSLV